MRRRLNVIVVVIDSLRAGAVWRQRHGFGQPAGPFLRTLSGSAVAFTRAYATECWTLPTHMSMFTGALPSKHGAHFQTMAYAGDGPTAGELFVRAGYHTEVISRNSLLDGTVPGVTRGFQVNTRIMADDRRTNLLLALTALGKPRLRRSMRLSGFFHVLQREQREFLNRLARMGLPADERALGYALERMAHLHRRGERFFLFVNLYDVHAPYCPSLESPLRSFRTLSGWRENLALPFVLPKISSHGYLRPGFRLSEYSRCMLLRRYESAVDLMDRKVEAFYSEARRTGLLNDAVFIVTSDHGEAFGEHALYFHDASVYNTHLHVPLWIHHPDVPSSVVDDVVSTRSLFDLLKAVAEGGDLRGTVLDAAARRAGPVALAEHFHYPYTDGLLPRYKHNIAAAIVGERKVIVRAEGLERYDLLQEPEEMRPEGGTLKDFEAALRRDDVPQSAIDVAVEHASNWLHRERHAGPPVAA